MSGLESLISQVTNPELRDRILSEVAKLKARRDWGLVFERHLPERARLHSAPVRVGSVVWERRRQHPRRLRVLSIEGPELVTVPELDGASEDTEGEVERIPLADVLVEQDFGRPAYPLLRLLSEVRQGPPERPTHTVICGENFHALQLLLASHPAAFDLIYLDPPYNTGDRDWSYDNNYVDPNDTYRSSKWLAFMERRLRLAKRLLAAQGVLVVAIDKNEHAHLVMLLEQMFAGYDITSVAIQHNPRGVQGDNFSYTNEFAVFVVPGKGRIAQREIPVEDREASDLRDHGGGSLRTDAATCFYPILIRDGEIIGFGDVPPEGSHPPGVNVERGDGVIEVWPIDVQQIERKWRYSRNTVEDIVDWLSVARVRGANARWDIKITKPMGIHRTVWFGPRYDSGVYGKKLIGKFAQQVDFSYPKSLYNLHDVIEAASGGRDDIRVLDFFAGSGTTLHAVMLLNAEDGGSRQCVLVTNNEVKAETAAGLNRDGHFLGDPEWEACGVFEAATRPRILAALSGRTPDDQVVAGRYLDDTGRPNGRAYGAGFEENVAFFRLEYFDRAEIEFGVRYNEMNPLLWTWAGALGEYASVSLTDTFALSASSPYAVLCSPDGTTGLLSALEARPDIRTVFIVASSTSTFASLAVQLPDGVRPIRLTLDYLEAVESSVR